MNYTPVIKYEFMIMM